MGTFMSSSVNSVPARIAALHQYAPDVSLDGSGSESGEGALSAGSLLNASNRLRFVDGGSSTPSAP